MSIQLRNPSEIFHKGESLDVILKRHKRWLDTGGAEGARADLHRAYLYDVDLRDACLSGADLRLAYLYNANLRNANLSFADLRSAYLWGADLWSAELGNADLRNANLYNADLSETKWGDNIPRIENIHKAVYRAASKPGVSKTGAHDRGAWHCGWWRGRAGWVVDLAGHEGALLEERIGTEAAAHAIYAASDPAYAKKTTPDFYASNMAAIADMALRAYFEESAA